MKLKYEKESYQIRGAIYEVYKEKGSGFLEAVYQECLEIEFKIKNIHFYAQKNLDIDYKGQILQQKYIPDFICYDKIIVEIKAVEYLTTKHESQIINYLHSTGYKLGFLVNFAGYPKVDIKRFVL